MKGNASMLCFQCQSIGLINQIRPHVEYSKRVKQIFYFYPSCFLMIVQCLLFVIKHPYIKTIQLYQYV